MELTDYQKKMLKCIKRHEPITKKKLAEKLHPNSLAEKPVTTIARVAKILGELEFVDLVYCSNPASEAWKVTDKALKLLK